jgi:hypothetical protein
MQNDVHLVEEYEIRPYRLGDEEGIVQLLELVFDGWPKFDLNCSPLDHWKWKYEDNPKKKNIITVSEIDKKIIGVAHSFPLMIKVGDRVQFCTFGGDTGVHPDFRRLSIHTKIAKDNMELKKEAGSQYHFIGTSNPILVRQFSKTRQLFPYPMMILARIQNVQLHLRINPVERVWLVRLGFQIMNLFNDIENIFRPSKLYKENFHLSEINSFDDRINEFWNHISEHYSFIVERKQHHMNWKYCDPRGGDYLVKIAEEEGHILGYSVLRINRYDKDYPVGYVVDMLAIPERLDVVEALIVDAISYFNSHNINIIISLVVKKHAYEKIFKKHRFLDSKRKPNIFYLSFGKIDELSNLKTYYLKKEVHLVYGDLDTI